MKLHSVGYWIIALLSCQYVVAQSSSAAANAVEAASADAKPSSMDAVYKNIQVLKGVPSTELPPIMHFMRSSLGVRCEFCHVAEDGKYQLDEKKEKQRAREMIVMVRQLNGTNFGWKNVVTCNTCHRGSTRPVAVPQIGSTFVNIIRREPDEPQPAPLPSVLEVLTSYEAATHMSTLNSALIRLEGSHAKVVDAGTPRARAIPRAASNAAEGLIQGDKAVTTSPLPGGQSVRVGSDGKRGWTVGPNGLHWINDADFVQFERKLNPLLVVRVRPGDFTSSRVSGVETINGRETYVITAVGADGIAQQLWFSKDDALLVRRTFYHPVALGLDPEQFDFSEYKSYGGIKVPSQINRSYLDDQHLGVLKKIIDIKLNVPVSDRDFMPPDK